MISSPASSNPSVIHAYGQTLPQMTSGYPRYVSTVQQQPRVYSIYISLNRVRKGELRTVLDMVIDAGMQPMICLTAKWTPAEWEVRAAALQAAGMNDKPIDTQKNWLAARFEFRDEQIAQGVADNELATFATEIAATPGTVYIRFMQETVTLYKWECRGPASFKAAWFRLWGRLPENAQMLYHPNAPDPATMREWMPYNIEGLAASIFQPSDFTRAAWEADLAYQFNIPYVLAECAPALGEFAAKGIRTSGVWNKYFQPYFDLIESGKVAMAVNCSLDWSSDPVFGPKGWPDTEWQSATWFTRWRLKQAMGQGYWRHGDG